MSEVERLKKNIDFKKVYSRGKSLADKYVVIYMAKNNLDVTRVGFTASKKVGKSVVRNRARRLIKESFRNNSKGIKKGYDLVFIARVSIKDANYKDVEKCVVRLLKRANLINS
ncbi:ribonuclease P protein component [Caminicella sporogenes DSM 14501]|uniref:Ribonuclease P protein component n=1 Tax=Caminicella sporogenes DSM 14501 TaxID=1121266 RepID=A0A1M6NCA1_9FIRM|nr:ribonuclease P protein component [Caminicella sporogenes]RKD22248.1 ribonuclease P protein component [Caminicella sporogenes]WIF95877.1 ribonuclease P protein component [Caminicella sporogenes]SHJ93350.1 ribonuclease P protein component [Caminicella sporogenes DSM 14501]